MSSMSVYFVMVKRPPALGVWDPQPLKKIQKLKNPKNGCVEE